MMTDVTYKITASYGAPVTIHDATIWNALEAGERWRRNRMFQDMNNNLWDNNPGEIERWDDDGGVCRDDA